MCRPQPAKKISVEETNDSIERIVKKVSRYELKKWELWSNQQKTKKDEKNNRKKITRDPKQRQELREKLARRRRIERRDKKIAKAIIKLSFLFVKVARELGHIKLDTNFDKISKNDSEDTAGASSDYDSCSCETSCSCSDCDEYSEFTSDSDSSSEESTSSSSSGSPGVPSEESGRKSAK